MSTNLAIAEVPEQIKALQATCLAVAEQSNLERLEQAVLATKERGVNNDHEQRQADDLAALIKDGAAELKRATDPVISYFDKLHDMALDQVKPYRKRFADSEKTIKTLMADYETARRAAQRKAQEEMEKAAADERARLAREAAKAMRNGDVATAKAAIAQAEATPTPVLSTSGPILRSTSFREPWDAKITDAMEVIKGIAGYPTAVVLGHLVVASLRNVIAEHGQITEDLVLKTAELIVKSVQQEEALAVGQIPLSVVKEWDIVFLKKEAAKRGGLQWPGIEAWMGINPAVRR